MAYISRAGWGARPPAGSRNALDPKPLGSGVHWNGPGCAASLRTHDKCAPFLRGIQNFHMGPQRGWSDIAYSLFVCPHGDVFEGRGKGVGTAAFGTNRGNRYYYAIYAMWGQGDGPAPAAMLDGITEAVALCRSWGAGSQVIGHRDENKGTECPGDELYRLVHAGRFSKTTTPAKTSTAQTYTREDVKRLQRVLGLEDDGLWGNLTEKQAQAIRRCLKPGMKRSAWDRLRYWRLRMSRPAGKQSSDSMRRAHQWALKVEVDGDWGEATDAAWLQMRQQHKR